MLVSNENKNSYFKLLFLCCWSRWGFIRWVLLLLGKIPYIGGSVNNIYQLFILVLIVMSLPVFKKANIIDGVIVFIIALCSVRGFLHEENIYVFQGLRTLLLNSFPYYFLGRKIDINAELSVFHKRMQMIDVMYVLAVIGIWATFLGQFYAVRNGTYNSVLENSGAATYTIIPIAFLIFYSFETKKMVSIITAFVGMIAMISYANRSAILAVVVFLIVCYFIYLQWSKYQVALALATSILGVFVYINYDALIIMLKLKFSQWGFNLRILNMIQANDGLGVANLNGRENVYRNAFELIQSHPFVGYGLFGEREILGGFNAYPHNIVLEHWIDFGIIIGSILFIGVLILLLRAIKAANNNSLVLGFLLSMAIPELVKLLFSGSYLVESFYFMFLGYCVNLIYEKRYKYSLKANN